jgi:RNA polymerase sigma-70 factor (ECF subfamily)
MKWRKGLAGTASASRAFEELLSEHLDALFGTALRLCSGRQADAEDLLQDAALRAFDGFGSLRQEAAGKAWLFTILVRTHLNRVRSAQRRAETLASDLDEIAFEEALGAWKPAPNPEELVLGRELRQRIGDALDGLGSDLRSIVHLVDVEGFPQREVARMLEIPEGTVASRLFRARRLLRDLLTPTACEYLWRQQ